jgi:hypothetical protein
MRCRAFGNGEYALNTYKKISYTYIMYFKTGSEWNACTANNLFCFQKAKQVYFTLEFLMFLSISLYFKLGQHRLFSPTNSKTQMEQR